MFVTSDIFDIGSMWGARRIGWREHLVGGINAHGTVWPGHEVAARFMLDAAKRCGFEEMHYAGYNQPGKWRTRSIAPKSFERLAQGRLAGAKDATSVLLRCGWEIAGLEPRVVYLGGTAGCIDEKPGYPKPIPLPGPPWRFEAGFTFPIDKDPIRTAGD
ncbi:MAG TPA: hypothetical protein VMU59_15940, partial [Caulobacteraceae bacterium]|nr:hypothetical protein [Caulobacteraceae bacterium]